MIEPLSSLPPPPTALFTSHWDGGGDLDSGHIQGDSGYMIDHWMYNYVGRLYDDGTARPMISYGCMWLVGYAIDRDRLHE